jgi:hypothetical protein
MRKLLPIILFSLIPLSGCSSPEPELSYDPIELIEYENCLNSPPKGTEDNWAQIAEIFCKNKKPILK